MWTKQLLGKVCPVPALTQFRKHLVVVWVNIVILLILWRQVQQYFVFSITYFGLFLSQLEIIKLKIFCLFIHSGKQQKSCLDLKFCDSDIESDWYSVILLQIDISYYFDVFFTVSWFIINEWKLSARPAPTTAHHSSIRRVWQEWLQWRRVRQSYCPGSHQPCLSWGWFSQWCWRLAWASHMITTTSYLTLRTKDGSDNCAFSESFPFHFTQSVTPSIKP